MKTEYTVVYDIAMDIFEAKVNRLIEKGWQVVGGICVNGGFYQAMIRTSFDPLGLGFVSSAMTRKELLESLDADAEYERLTSGAKVN